MQGFGHLFDLAPDALAAGNGLDPGPQAAVEPSGAQEGLGGRGAEAGPSGIQQPSTSGHGVAQHARGKGRMHYEGQAQETVRACLLAACLYCTIACLLGYLTSCYIF